MTTSTIQKIAAQINIGNVAFRHKTKRKKNNHNRVKLTFNNLSQRGTQIRLEKPIQLDGTVNNNSLSWYNGRVICENEKMYKIPHLTLNRIINNCSFVIDEEIEQSNEVIIRII